MDYRRLVMRSQQQPVTFDFIILPGSSEKTVKFTSVFSFPYSYLPFKKSNRPGREEFYSNASLSMEVFKADPKKFGKRKNENISVEGLEPVGRSFWTDTVYAKSYEESQSKQKFLTGFLDISLKPGIYNYVLQMKRGEETDSRLSRTQSVRVEPYDKMKRGNVILGKTLNTDKQTPQIELTKMGNDVIYGKDFYALAYIPRYESGGQYTLEINSLEVADEDTSRKKEVYTQQLTQSDIRTGIKPQMASSDGSTYVNLRSSEDGFAYALVKIPNSNFPNSLFRFTVKKDGEEAVVSQGTFRSRWVDMPTSLLSLDVSIDMLKYIADKETIKNISNGSHAEREQKFRKFWKERDPTPKTEFNELMAEYYRRIDYAYEHFTTENTVGYNSDQGEVYIKFGPPKDIDRKFPTSGPTTEIWTYPNRKFVFRATTGFGDFKLVSDQSK